MKPPRLVSALALTVMLATVSIAQAPPPTLAIRNATLIDGTGKPPVKGVTVLITRDRITRVTSADVSIPGGVRVIDASGLTVLPGLMDMHVHSRAWM